MLWNVLPILVSLLKYQNILQNPKREMQYTNNTSSASIMIPDSIDDEFLFLQRRFLRQINHQREQGFGIFTNDSDAKCVQKGQRREETNDRLENKREYTSSVGIDTMNMYTFREWTPGEQGQEKNSTTKTTEDFINPFEEDLSDNSEASFSDGSCEMDIELPMDTASSMATSPEQQIFEHFKTPSLSSYQELCPDKKKEGESTNKITEISNTEPHSVDLEPLPFIPKEQPNHLKFSHEEYSEALQKLKHRMNESLISQRLIINYDRKMGLKKNHSKTMRETTQSRKQVNVFIRKQAKIIKKQANAKWKKYN